MFSVVPVHQSTSLSERGSHLPIIYDALDLFVQGTPPTLVLATSAPALALWHGTSVTSSPASDIVISSIHQICSLFGINIFFFHFQKIICIICILIYRALLISPNIFLEMNTRSNCIKDSFVIHVKVFIGDDVPSVLILLLMNVST